MDLTDKAPEGTRDRLIPVPGRMLIDHRRACARMAQTRHQLLHARAGRGRESPANVTQVVEMQTRQSVLPACGIPGRPEVRTSQRGTHRANEHEVWPLVHASQYTELAPVLAALIPGLETAARNARTDELRRQARELLADTYQAVAAMIAKLGEADVAWIAADRAAFAAEAIGQPLMVAASMYRMAHVFLSLGQTAQAQQVATAAANTREPLINAEQPGDSVVLYGALQLVLAVTAGRDNERAIAYQRLAEAGRIAEQTRAGPDAYDTEFGPANVGVHAVSVAVELGDAGHAIDLARELDTSDLSPERRSRHLIDLAAAHTMRRQIGEALSDLQEAEAIAPELTRSHYAAREVTRDLLQLSGLRPRPELRDLAERFGVLP